MNEREKKLLLAIIALLIPLGGYFAYSRFDSAQSKYQNSIYDLSKKTNKKKQLIKRGARAARKIKTLQAQSLPGQTKRAESLYRNWLLTQLREQKMEQISVIPSSRRALRYNSRKNSNKRRAYEQISYSIKARGDLKQFTQFLHKFYSLDCLHRIPSIIAKPLKDSKKLDLVMTIEALVLPGTERHKTLDYLAASQIEELSAYSDVIINRNLFAPPNQPPKIDSLGKKEIGSDEELSLTVKATDPDEFDKVTYSIRKDPAQQGDIPKIDPQSGELTFPPQEIGDYKFTVLATDDGLPAKTVEETLEISVVKQSPKEKPDFDDAKLTTFTGRTKSGNRWMMWLRFLTTNETVKLYEGDTFELGKLKGVIHRISTKDVELTAANRRMLVKLGQNLSDGEMLQETKKEPSPAKNSASQTPTPTKEIKAPLAKNDRLAPGKKSKNAAEIQPDR